jgi:hypothetical protein
VITPNETPVKASLNKDFSLPSSSTKSEALDPGSFSVQRLHFHAARSGKELNYTD